MGTVGNVRRGAALALLLVSVATGFAAEKAVRIDAMDSVAEWTFSPGGEFVGAKGSLTLEEKQAKEGKGFLRLEGDFSGGGRYVAMYRDFEKPVDVQTLQLWVKGENVTGLGLRLTDSTGQCHQHIVKLDPEAKGWQQITKSGFRSMNSWGGEGDKQWHGPLTKIGIMLMKEEVADAASKAVVDVDLLQGSGKE